MNKNVVVMGGGNGTMPVLSGLKKFKDLRISAVVNMTDDGGSNAAIRDEFGLLPLSDLRKTIIALSANNNVLLHKLFSYRFHNGKGISGHTLGNLMMAALVEITGSEQNALKTICDIFKTQGKILPVTLRKTTLAATYDDGKTVFGEHLIDEPEEKMERHVKKLFIKPAVEANADVIKSINKADCIIVGPGDLYTSTIANIIVGEVAGAIKKSKAKYIFISNLMTKHGQTHDMSAKNLVTEIAKYSGRLPDVVVVHNKPINKKLLAQYLQSGEQPIKDDLGTVQQFKVVRADIIKDSEVKRDAGDTLVRSFIRHDAKKLARVLRKIIKQ